MIKGSLQIKNGIYQAVFYAPGKKSAIWRSTGIKVQRGNKRKAEQKTAENKKRNIHYVVYIFVVNHQSRS